MRKSLLDLIEENNIEDIQNNISNYDVNYIFYQGTPNETTALIYAVYYDRLEIVELLLENGANPNIQNYEGETAIMFSNNEITKLLLENGADINIKDNQGRNVLERPLNDNKLEVIKIFISTKKLKITDFLRSHIIGPDLIKEILDNIYPQLNGGKPRRIKSKKKKYKKKNKKRRSKKNKKKKTKRNK